MLRFRHHADGGIVEGTAESPEELGRFRLAIPVEPPEVWCAGVTYQRSRDARVEESTVKDVYTLVYDADRPELFMKDAGCRRTVGPGEPIGVRADSGWDVPEPEMGVVLGEGGALAGLTIGNDVSSRSIEGENPLYIAQAKTFAGACAIGPAVLVPDDWGAPLEIRLRITGTDGAELFAGETSSAMMQTLVRGAGRVAAARQPGPGGQRPADRHRSRPARTTSRSSPGTRSRSPSRRSAP